MLDERDLEKLMDVNSNIRTDEDFTKLTNLWKQPEFRATFYFIIVLFFCIILVALLGILLHR